VIDGNRWLWHLLHDSQHTTTVRNLLLPSLCPSLTFRSLSGAVITLVGILRK